jgi:hypothetical protein
MRHRRYKPIRLCLKHRRCKEKFMWLKLVFCIFVILFPVAMVVAQEDGPNGPGEPGAKLATAMSKDSGEPDAKTGSAIPDGSGDSDAKMVTGMSVLGNKEAPMSLFIVPWKSSELGAETNLTRTLNERHSPVDREVFLREVAFYEVSVGSKGSAPAAVSQPLH